MTLSLLLLFACTSGGHGPGIAPEAEQVVIDLSSVKAVSGEEHDLRFGMALASGCDLDHDGRAEWVVGAPHILEEHSEYQAVRVYSGTELITSRFPAHDDRPDEHGYYVTAGKDLDGDGFADAAFTTNLVSLATPPRTAVMHSTHETDDTVFLLDLPEGEFLGPEEVRLVDRGQGVGFFISWARRWDVWGPEGFEVGEVQWTDDAETRVDHNSAGGLVFPGTTSTTDTDGDGVDEFLVGYWSNEEPRSGSSYICPLDLGIEVPEDCQLVAEGLGIGGYQIGGDLDGDGVPEIISSEVAANGSHGSASIYKTDGTRVARIEGTRNAMFGRNPTYVVDDAGDPWLLVGQTHLSGQGRPTIWGFRGEQLQGDLVDVDALRVWEGDAHSVGKAITTYRELPSDPLQLLIGSPDQNVVYMLPFDPE